MNPALLGGIFSIGEKLINHWFPDAEEADKRKAELALLIQQGKLQELETVAKVIIAEAQSEHWLTANWRPVVMLTFAGLVVAHWLGFTAEGLGEAEVLSLLDIVKVGIGGYVIGRSAEKVVKVYKDKS